MKKGVEVFAELSLLFVGTVCGLLLFRAVSGLLFLWVAFRMLTSD